MVNIDVWIMLELSCFRAASARKSQRKSRQKAGSRTRRGVLTQERSSLLGRIVGPNWVEDAEAFWGQSTMFYAWCHLMDVS